ncbi:hypothetical protein P3W33_12075 [Luteibacter sp. PPL552]|jgi:hypothetical protein
MSDDVNDDYLNYLSQLRKTLEVASAAPSEQCEVMGSYNAPWELKTDAKDFIDSVLLLQRGRLDPATIQRLNGFRRLVLDLSDAAVVPEDESMTTLAGCMVAFKHPAWIPVRRSASELLSILPDPFEKS